MATAPQRAAMVGNSLRSDVLPAIEAGGWGVHVPHDLTWSYEAAEAPADHAALSPHRRARRAAGGAGRHRLNRAPVSPQSIW